MSPGLTALIEAGRGLTPEERFELAHQMLISVDESAEDQGEIDAAWTTEIGSRVDDVLTGRVKTVPFRQTYEQLRAELDARRP